MSFFQKKLPWQSPLSVFPHVKEQNPMLFFSGNSQGKFSFLPFAPRKIWHLETEQDANNMEQFHISFCNSKNWETTHWHFPFSGGLCGAFAYDFGLLKENIEGKHQKNFSSLLGFFGLYTQFFAFDHTKKELFFAGFFEDENAFQLEFSALFSKNLGFSDVPKKLDGSLKPIFLKSEYEKKFFRCQTELEKGNSFQINFSQVFEGETFHSPWEIFCAATQKNPASMMFFTETNWQGEIFSLISCSPERLFSMNADGKILTQPIAGTRPRGKTEEEDEKLENELKNSTKEMAEHTMIVDLLRNDMGRISEFGSVKVKNFAHIEKYATVMHLVSDVEGQLMPQKNVFDVLWSFFPGGTITGTPKHETMKILGEEEIFARGFYCGSAGYISFSRHADFNILIRTLSVLNGKMVAHAGGGLVFGANCDAEYDETFHKISGLQKIFH